MSRPDRARLAHFALLSALLGTAACGSSPSEVAPGQVVTRTFISDSLPAGSAAGLFSTPPADPGAPVAKGGLFYTAAVVPVDTTAGSPPMSLSIEVRVLNPTSAAVSLPVRGCTVWPEFRATADSAEPLWVPQGQCAQDSYVVVIEPGQHHVFSFLAHDVMLSRALEDGRYRVTAQFRHAQETLRLDAGSADVRLRVRNLAFHVQLQEQGRDLAASVRVENLNAHAVHLEWGDCAVGIQLYRDAALAGPPQRIEAERTCLRYLATIVLAPGAELSAKEFSYSSASGWDRNPALVAGEYHAVVSLELNWRTYRFPMGVVNVR